MDILNILGNAASIIGLGVTLWILRRVRNIERAFLKQALMPSRMRILRGHIGNLERAIDTKNRQSTLQELERCRSLLRALCDYLDGDRQKNSEQTAQAIERLCRLGDENKFWAGCGAVLARLHGVHEGLKTLVKELEWRTKDAN